MDPQAQMLVELQTANQLNRALLDHLQAVESHVIAGWFVSLVLLLLVTVHVLRKAVDL